MQKKKVIVYGIGRFAEYAAFVFQNDSPYTVDGFSIESSLLEMKKNPIITHQDYLPFEELSNLKSPKDHDLFIAVGNNVVRERLYLTAKQQGFKLASYISSKASFWPNLQVGENSFIGEGSVIQPFVRIGNNSIHFGSRIGHHSLVMDHTLLSGTTIGGNTRIGEGSYLGLNSTVQQNIHIGARNIIGMNVSIEENTAENSVYTHKGSQKRALTYDQIAQRFLL